jgi:LPXTG-motif cell wall-anchored protein
MSLFSHPLVIANSSCIGTGCPGTTGSGHIGSYIVGLVLILAGAGGLYLAQRRNRRQRVGVTEPQAASVSVTLGRAGSLLAALIGVLCLLFPF